MTKTYILEEVPVGTKRCLLVLTHAVTNKVIGITPWDKKNMTYELYERVLSACGQNLTGVRLTMTTETQLLSVPSFKAWCEEMGIAILTSLIPDGGKGHRLKLEGKLTRLLRALPNPMTPAKMPLEDMQVHVDSLLDDRMSNKDLSLPLGAGLYPLVQSKPEGSVKSSITPIVENMEGLMTQSQYSLLEENMAARHNEVVSNMQAHTNDLAMRLEVSLLQNNALAQGLGRLKEELEETREVARIQKEQIDKREQAKLKKQNRTKQKVRDAISLEQFQMVFDTLGEATYKEARIKMALMLMYVTGLRINNLTLLSVRQCKDLLKEGKTIVQLNKRGRERKSIQLSKGNWSRLKAISKCIEKVIGHKTLDLPLITSQTEPNKVLSRSLFNRECNAVLKSFSQQSGLNVRSHSLRASYITDSLALNGLDMVQRDIGHVKPSTTMGYDHRTFTEKDVQIYNDRLDDGREGKHNLMADPRSTHLDKKQP